MGILPITTVFRDALRHLAAGLGVLAAGQE
jgi:hypothetical protein